MPLSNRDYDLLSAYIDGDVTSDERREIEGRLESDAEFASELAALRRTIDLVRGLPTLTALRDLRLTPAMVGEQDPAPRTEPTRYPPLRPTFRQQVVRFAPNLVAAAASFVLVVAGAVTLLQPTAAPTASVPVVAMQTTESLEMGSTLLNEAEDDGSVADADDQTGVELPEGVGDAARDRQQGEASPPIDEATAGADATDLSMAARAAEPAGTPTAAPTSTPAMMYESAPSESQGAGALAPMPTVSALTDTMPASAAQAPGVSAMTDTANFAAAPTLQMMLTSTPAAAPTTVAEIAPPVAAEESVLQSVSAPQQPSPLGIVLVAAGLALGLLALIARPRRRE